MDEAKVIKRVGVAILDAMDIADGLDVVSAETYATAAIAAHKAALSEAGYVIVPREPTEAMRQAGRAVADDMSGAELEMLEEPGCARIFTAMVNASEA